MCIFYNEEAPPIHQYQKIWSWRIQIAATHGLCLGKLVGAAVIFTQHFPELRHLLEVEAGIYAAQGAHPRILEFKGVSQSGILLGLASNGSLATVLKTTQTSASAKLAWALQASEAVEHIHSRNVLHCDLNATNFLMDHQFNLLLSDFQGCLLPSDGAVLLDGGVSENSKYRMPGKADGEADIQTDLFALGSTLYHIVQGHPPFPELDTIDDESAIEHHFEAHKYPPCNSIAGMSPIIHKCWAGNYVSAKEVVEDVKALRATFHVASRPDRGQSQTEITHKTNCHLQEDQIPDTRKHETIAGDGDRGGEPECIC